ncbi:MAG: hypothetical protein JSR59_17070 [Proteobacteria bacterium]|nr:hypothetical protein [Pseudomonadota bacterium]
MKPSTRIGGLSMLTALLAGCAAPAAYQPPPTPETTDFSRDMNASFDQVWAAVTYVAGSTFFDIHNFDKGSGLMTLTYSNLRGGPGPYITCGTMTGELPPLSTITPEPNSVLNGLAQQMALSGRANITVRPRGAGRTTVQINSGYDLVVSGQPLLQAQRVVIGHWQFTSREADTQPVLIGLQRTMVTCRPSYKIERDFLTEVAARL